MELTGKRVVIIGGSSGIGLAVAQMAATQGAKVLIAGRSVEKLKNAREHIAGKVGSYPLDLTRDLEVERLFARVGSLDHLVITAGAGAMGPFLDLPLDTFRHLFEVKFWGACRAARLCAGRIADGGTITLFSGIAARRPAPGLSAYAAVNGAVEGLCRALALELAPVRVNAVSPGIVETPAYASMPEEDRQAFFEQTARRLPVQKVGQPDDAASAALFLMKNGYVTGTVLSVDGGGGIA